MADDNDLYILVGVLCFFALIGGFIGALYHEDTNQSPYETCMEQCTGIYDNEKESSCVTKCFEAMEAHPEYALTMSRQGCVE